MNEPEKILGASEPLPGGPVEDEVPPPPPPTPGNPVPFLGEMTYQDFLNSGSHIPTPAELELTVDGSEGGPFDPPQTTYTVLNIGSVIVRSRARTNAPWLLLEPVVENPPAQFDPEPDPVTGQVDRIYPPSEVVSPHPAQRLRVFYPDPIQHAMPVAGWPFVLHVGAGNFMQSAPFASIQLASARLFYKLLERGIAVVSVGCVGINSSGLGPAPNLFHDQGTNEWDDFSLFWGEKDVTWAWLRVQHEASLWGLDKTRGFVTGASSGASITSWVALGPDRGGGAWGGLSPMLQETTTNCAGVLAIEAPAWWDALVHSFPGFHFESASAPGARAATLGAAKPSDLRAASPSIWIRQDDSAAETTPVLLAYDDAALSSDFSRDGQGNPTLSNELDPAQALHPYWSGVVLFQDLLGVAPSFHSSVSELWAKRGFELPNPNNIQTGLIATPLNVLSPQFHDVCLRWILKRLGRDFAEARVPPRRGRLFRAVVDMHSVMQPPGSHAGIVTVENQSSAQSTAFPVDLDVS